MICISRPFLRAAICDLNRIPNHDLVDIAIKFSCEIFAHFSSVLFFSSRIIGYKTCFFFLECRFFVSLRSIARIFRGMMHCFYYYN